jgi:hypothetical protein
MGINRILRHRGDGLVSMLVFVFIMRSRRLLDSFELVSFRCLVRVLCTVVSQTKGSIGKDVIPASHHPGKGCLTSIEIGTLDSDRAEEVVPSNGVEAAGVMKAMMNVQLSPQPAWITRTQCPVQPL